MTATRTRVSNLKITWPLLPDDFVLPNDPVEDTEHNPIANALTQALTAMPELLQNALITTNFALCAGVNDKTICKAPDWMYVRPVPPWPHAYARRSYTPHTEGPIPMVVMEFLSAGDNDEYSHQSRRRIGKWVFYEQVVKVPIYVIFKPETAELEVNALESERYLEQTPNEAGRYWIPGLNLFLGVWQGSSTARTGDWLRWWDEVGELLLWPEEREAQQRQRAEEERQRAEEERQRAEEERQRAEEERQRAEEERQRADAAEQRVAQLAERLRHLGVDPDS